MTGAQERAWRELWPALGIENSEAPLDFTAAFGRDAPVVLEIGFGNGESLVALAMRAGGRDNITVVVVEVVQGAADFDTSFAAHDEDLEDSFLLETTVPVTDPRGNRRD